jgi:ornithine cyclodeaminase/alanine dehydrogenase-like protein (mu-crystallin family)
MPGAYRTVTAQDIRDLTKCSLIGRYGYYGRSDIEIVRAVLQYEQIRLKREQQANTVRTCKRCGEVLPESERVGRPREYCSDCEKNWGRERWRKWSEKDMF